MDASHLKSVDLFASLSDDQRRRLAQWADEIDVDTGHHLIRQDGFGYEFFVILSGTAEVMDGEDHLADVVAGDFVGEIALTEGVRRSASVRATAPMRLIVMGRTEFLSMASQMPSVAEQIRSRIAERLENNRSAAPAD